MISKQSSSRIEPECEKVWKAGRELERAGESIEDVKYHLGRIVQNKYAPELILRQAKAYLQALDSVADFPSSEIQKAVHIGVEALSAGEENG